MSGIDTGNMILNRSWWVYVFILAAVYCGAALLGNQLAFAPSEASPFWPAAGVAIAGLLIGGLTLWPGILLGDIVFNLINVGGIQDIANELGWSTVTAAGATLQAVAGAAFIGKYLRSALDGSLASIVKIYLIGVVACCLISATTAVSIGVLRGTMPEAMASAIWFSWWIGDSIGVMLFAPVILWIAYNVRSSQSARYHLLFPPLLLSSAILVGTIAWFHSDEESEARQELYHQSSQRFNNFTERFTSAITAINASSLYLSVLDEITEEGIADYTAKVKEPALLTVAWLPRTENAEPGNSPVVAGFASSRDITITSFNDQNELVPANVKAEYYPVVYASSGFLDSELLGYDASSDSLQQSSIESARDSGEAAFGNSFSLIGDDVSVITYYAPVYTGNLDVASASVQERRDNLKGVVVGIIGLDELGSSSDSTGETATQIYTLSDVETGTESVLNSNYNSDIAQLQFLNSQRFDPGSGEFQWNAYTAPGYWVPGSSAESRMFLIGVLLTVALFSLILLNAITRGRLTSGLIDARTKELNTEREKLSQALDIANVFAWKMDVHDRLVTMDDRAYSLLGTSAELEGGYTLAVDQWIERYVHPEDIKPLMLSIGEEWPSDRKASKEFEGRLLCRDGSIRYVIFRFNAQYVDGSLTAILGTTQDITQRKAMTIALRESEEYSRSIIGSSQDCIQILDMEGKILDVTDRGIELLGISDLTLVRNTEWSTFWDRSRDRAAVATALAEARSGRSGSFQGYASAEDGSHKWWDVVVTPILDADGNPVRLLAVSRDITIERESQLELEVLNASLEDEVYSRTVELAESERQLRATVDNAAVGILHISVDGTILRSNPKFTEIVGYELEDIRGMVGEQFLHPDDRIALEKFRAQLSNSTELPFKRELRCLQKSGSYRWLRATSSEVINETESSRYRVVIVEDIDEQKQVEQAMVESEERYREMFDSTPIPMWAYDCETLLISAVNNAAVENYGYSREEFLSMTLADIFADKEAACNSVHVRSAGLVDILKSTDQLHRRKDGSIIHADMSSHMLSDSDTRSRIILANDITESVRGAAELHQQQELNRLLLENLSEGVVACDKDGELILFNKAAREWHGTDPRNTPPEKWSEYYDLFEADGETPLSTGRIPLMRAFGGEQVRGDEMSIRRAGEQPRFVLASGEPLIGSNGEKLGAVVVMHDITERKLAASDLERQQELNRLILENLAEGVVACDKNGDLLMINKAAREWWYESNPEAELRGSVGAITEVYSGDGRRLLPPNETPMARALQGEQVRGEEIRISNFGNVSKLLVASGEPLVNADSEKLGAVVVLHDITEREVAQRELKESARRLQEANTAIENERSKLADRVSERTAELTMTNEELKKAKTEAESASRAKSAFLAVMSHEIRTPMNGIVGMVDVLSHGALDEEQEVSIKTIKDSAFSLLNIIDDILDFSKIEASRMQLENCEVDLSELAESVADTFSATAGDKGVLLDVFVDPQLPHSILCDPTRLRQVIMNLVGNAIKFSSGTLNKQGRVKISVESDERNSSNLYFKVIDNGIGISAQQLPKLFDSFSQAESSTTRVFGGTGLGLTICKRLVELMGGNITVNSEPSQGATFTVCLPLQAVAEDPRTIENLSGVEFVCVDSEGTMAQELGRYLESAGASVKIETDLQAVTEMVKSSQHGRLTIIQRTGLDRPSDSQLQALVSDFEDASFLLINHGRRRQPRIIRPGLVSMDDSLIRRFEFLQAAAIAAGKVEPLESQESREPLRIARENAPTISEARQTGQLILVAEDDKTNQKVILRQLGMLGYAAEVAVDGSEAWEMWQSGHYACVATDLHMPNMDGYELARKIRASGIRGKSIPILMLTANALSGEERKAKECGIDAYLTKPLQLKVLGEALSKLMLKNDAVAEVSTVIAEEAVIDKANAIDLTALDAVIGDDEEVRQEVLSEYLDSLEQIHLELVAACDERQAARVASLAHRLKGSSRTVGAIQLGELCAELENAGRAEDFQSVRRFFGKIEPELQDVSSYIQKSLAA